MRTLLHSEKGQSDAGFMVVGIGLFVLGIIAVILLIGYISSYNGTGPGEVCVVQQGGPFDGRAVKEIRQGGEGPKSIGIWNGQHCFPATQRNYIVSSDPTAGDAKTVDSVQVQTQDAQTVNVNGQALFRLNTDPAVVKDFYRKYGVRTFDGKHPYDGDSGWSNFLTIQFRPVLDNALREAIGGFNCTELNSACQYVTQADQAVKGKVQKVNTGQNIAAAQQKIETQLQADLNSTLGGNYFENIRWRFSGSHRGGAISFSDEIAHQIEQAQAKQTQVAQAKLDAERRVADAKGNTRVARQQAEQIRLKSKAYANNPQQAAIDKLRALCGPNGCNNLQVLGGSATKLLK